MENENLKKIIDQMFEFAYLTQETDEDYQQTFANEGSRKAQYIVDNLHYHEARGHLLTSDMGYLCIGGADGSEVELVLTSTEISRAVMIEISDGGVRRAKSRASELAAQGKTLVIYHGDVTARLDEGLRILEGWCRSGNISGLVCSSQSVLHELPVRSPGFDLSIFLGKLFRSPCWRTCAFYSREPCSPMGWPSNVRVRLAGLAGADFARAAAFVRDRLRMSGSPEVLASNWVDLPSPLAIETLHKLTRGSSIRRIGYELGEQLTAFDPMAVKVHLESYLKGMRVTVDYVTTSGFRQALHDYEVEYVGHDSNVLPLPKTHSEVVGIRSSLAANKFLADSTSGFATQSASGPQLSRPIEIQRAGGPSGVRFTNPFHEDISDTRIRRWLDQFEPSEQPLMARLLDGFTYVDFQEMLRLNKILHAEVQARLGVAESDAWFVPLGGVARSGALVSYFYRRENKIPTARFLDYAGVAQISDLKNGGIVLLDDLLASGHQAVAEWVQIRELAKVPRTCRVAIAALACCDAGRRYVEEHTDIMVCTALKLPRTNEPLDPTSTLFRSDEERAQARHIIKKYGEILSPRSPFGYAGSGLLLSFAHSTPDNCLPIFWSTTGGWFPLFMSGGSGRIGLGADA